jgi:large conductance mechanosensitive channel
VVTPLVNDIIMPPIGYVLDGVDFSSLQIVLGTHTDGTGKVTQVAIRYGNFINVVVAFIVVAFVVFMIARTFIRTDWPPSKICPFCKEPNALNASKCKFCTSSI